MGKNFSFSEKMAFFSFKTYLYRSFWLEFEISASELTNVPNFSAIGQDKRTQILTWNDTENSLMTSYFPPVMASAKFLWLLRDFAQSTIMPSLVVIGPQIKEKQRGAQCAPPPAYMVPKDPSLNRVNYLALKYILFRPDTLQNARDDSRTSLVSSSKFSLAGTSCKPI